MDRKAAEGNLTKVNQAQSLWKRFPQSNIMPVGRWAQKYMREHQLVAIPCDKEFGSCLETLETHSKVQMDILTGNAYDEVNSRTVDKQALFAVYAKWCFAVAALEKIQI